MQGGRSRSEIWNACRLHWVALAVGLAGRASQTWCPAQLLAFHAHIANQSRWAHLLPTYQAHHWSAQGWVSGG